MVVETLHTSRLILRPLTAGDLDALAEMYADPDVMRFLPGGPRSRDAATAALQSMMRPDVSPHFGFWAVEHKEHGRMIGRVALLRHQGVSETEVAYLFARAYWGQGLATEAARALRDFAFRTLNDDPLISIVHRDNLASQRVAQKNGMSLDREQDLFGFPVRIYAIDRQTWETQVSP